MTSILPRNASPFTKAVEEVCAVDDILRPALEEIRGIKFHRPLNVTVAPSLVVEYGLGPIAEFFGTIEELIDSGRPWQLLRGTRAAKHLALAWIGYNSISIEDQNVGRRRWHLQHIDMGKLPTALTEDDLLGKAEYLFGLSGRARTLVFRGFHGYDVRALRWSRSRWSNSMWGDSSGVRINGGSVKWSHGREHHIVGSVDPQIYVRLGIGFLDGDALSWNTPLVGWNTPGITWNGVLDADAARAWYLGKQSMYFSLREAAGNVIGYARCFEVSDITGTEDFDDGARYLKMAAVVPFMSAPGRVATSISIVMGGLPKAGVKPAKRWYPPSEIDFPDGELRLLTTSLSIELMKTCRERISAVVEI